MEKRKRLVKVSKYFPVLLVFFLFSNQKIYAEDFGQHVPESLPESLNDERYLHTSDEDDEEFLDAYSGEYLSAEKRSPLEKSIENSPEEIDSHVISSPELKYEKVRAEQEKDFTTSGQEFLGTHEEDSKFIIKTKKDFLNEYNRKAKGSFGFSFIQDNFTYEDQNNVFEQTFRRDDSSGMNSDFHGIIRLHGVQYFNKDWLKLGWGGAVGVGYNGGQGVFRTTGNISEAHVKLWTIPIEAFLDLSLDLTSYVQLNLQVAGSVVGLIQSRSDFEDLKELKRQRQIGLGYGLTGFLKLNLSKIFPSHGFGLLSFNSINRYYLHLMIRNQSYGSFKSEDLSISGTSFGAGFSFDYL